MKTATTALILLLAGCNETETGRSDTLYWFVWEHHTRPSAELISETEDILALELVESDRPEGAATVFLEENRSGWSRSGGWSCTPYVYLENHDAPVLAHELGHAFGLTHTDDDSNLMFSGPPSGLEITEQQTDTIRKRLWETEQYCRQ